MNNKARIHVDELDKEWIDLVLTARQLGLTLEHLREFLHNSSTNLQDDPNEQR